MRRGRSPRRAVRLRLAGGNVDSRWWYWVAAVPAVFAFWAVAVVWVTVAVAIGPLADANPVVQAAEISMVAFVGPFLVLVGVFPFAVHSDASAILAADVEWQPSRATLTGAATVGPLLAAAAAAFDWLGDGSLDVPGWAVLGGFLLAVPAATYYLYQRHEHLGVP